MAVTCGASCAKFMLFVFNFLFFLSGVALLGVGIWMIAFGSVTDVLDVLNYADNRMRTVAYIFIGVGVFIFIVGFFGCCGAIRESKCLLGLYIFLLLVVMGIEIAAGVLAIVYKDTVQDKVDDQLTKTLQTNTFYNSSDKTYSVFGSAFNIAQRKFQCCGVKMPSDYENSTFQTNNKELLIPYSCCKLKDDAKYAADLPQLEDVKNWALCKTDYQTKKINPTELNNKGCNVGIVDWAKTKLVILVGVGLGIAALELFGFIFAMCLCRNIDPKEP